MNPILLIFIFIFFLVGGLIFLRKSTNKSIDELYPRKEDNNELVIANNSTNELQVQFNMLSEYEKLMNQDW